MAEEPEQVLPEDRPAGRRIVDVGVEDPVGDQCQQGGRQQREDQDHQHAGEQQVPGEDRHPEHGLAGGPLGEDRGDQVDRAENGAETGENQADGPEVAADALAVFGAAQRGVGGPAEVGRAGGRHQPEHGDRAAEEIEPVREGVQPGEGDVGRADLQRNQVVAEAEDHRRREEEQHDRAVHGEELVVLLGGEELQLRPGQFGADQQGHHPADEEEDERAAEVEQPDLLVVGGAHQPQQHTAGGDRPDRPGVAAVLARGQHHRPVFAPVIRHCLLRHARIHPVGLTDKRDGSGYPDSLGPNKGSTGKTGDRHRVSQAGYPALSLPSDAASRSTRCRPGRTSGIPASPRTR